LISCATNPKPTEAVDAGTPVFKSIGAACQADQPPRSECGFAPQFFCDTRLPQGYCKSACNSDGDCTPGSVCAGAEADAGSVGECKKACSQATATTDCRIGEGYQCRAASAGASHDYCDLIAPSFDAGAEDGGG